MNCKERCPLCGSRDSPKLTEEQIACILQKGSFEDNRAKNIAQALVKAGFGFKDALETFSFNDGDAVNECVPDTRILLGEVRRIEQAFNPKHSEPRRYYY
jgi:hypothetical protein